MVNGMKPVNLSLDNYFVNREFTPRETKKGNTIMSLSMPLDIATFTDNIQRLLKGEEVEIPKFSFETGQRYYDGEKLKNRPEQCDHRRRYSWAESPTHPVAAAGNPFSRYSFLR